eukprot:scaffold28014_cov106-Isochrysis_galbana.AAC.3
MQVGRSPSSHSRLSTRCAASGCRDAVEPWARGASPSCVKTEVDGSEPRLNDKEDPTDQRQLPSAARAASPLVASPRGASSPVSVAAARFAPGACVASLLRAVVSAPCPAGSKGEAPCPADSCPAEHGAASRNAGSTEAAAGEKRASEPWSGEAGGRASVPGVMFRSCGTEDAGARDGAWASSASSGRLAVEAIDGPTTAQPSTSSGFIWAGGAAMVSGRAGSCSTLRGEPVPDAAACAAASPPASA